MSSTEISQKTSHEDEDHFLFAMQLAGVSVLPMVMQVAAELGLFDIIAKAGPGAQMSPKIIASHLPTQNANAVSMLDRILRLLTGYKVLNSSVSTNDDGLIERLYGLAPVCKYFVQNEDGVSLLPLMLLVQDKVFMDSWGHLKDAVLEGGIAFNKAHGMHAFEYPGLNPRFNQVFNKAMFNHTTIVMKKILETYNGFENFSEVVDVGGGVGTTISLITAKYPSIKGINFDLPHVNQHHFFFLGHDTLNPRKYVSGNMFESVPRAEAIFMKWILHDWSDDHNLSLLKNCYNALPDHEKVIIVEHMLHVAAENNIAAIGVGQKDLIMLSQNPGGKERTEEEFYTLARKAGFASIKKVCFAYNYSENFICFYKK
ncbi:hypothetical protein AQUCO_02800080v1 [Aquilegia coerulea]|uniref:O-methyltransferase domain-containing protein n=1 Tax=Aquilegia coerulea TaxID=218851 RepID=A0A2G5D3T7_AQUCA|nr:hypothetical protein AQUCO_02800080v1 [Aquilegia coerulea]